MGEHVEGGCVHRVADFHLGCVRLVRDMRNFIDVQKMNLVLEASLEKNGF
jgi:hypothetical protein